MEVGDVVLGFDPGGSKAFGWAVCRSDGQRLHVQRTGVVSEAEEALVAVSKILPHVVAAGIDAPLFWARSGGRRADAIVRKAVQACGHAGASGTVQQVNSLRGACLVQGVLLGHLIHQSIPHALITEAHPKALLWLLKTCELSDLVDGANPAASEHERDAVLAAYAAWMGPRADWRNLFEDEPCPVLPLGTPVNYWMPLPVTPR